MPRRWTLFFFLPESENSTSTSFPVSKSLNYRFTCILLNVILAGLINNACILSTASELYVGDLDVYVPSDCVAVPVKQAHRDALALMKISFEVDATPSTKLNFAKNIENRTGLARVAHFLERQCFLRIHHVVTETQSQAPTAAINTPITFQTGSSFQMM